jgi:hypothetical protein
MGFSFSFFLEFLFSSLFFFSKKWEGGGRVWHEIEFGICRLKLQLENQLGTTF